MGGGGNSLWSTLSFSLGPYRLCQHFPLWGQLGAPHHLRALSCPSWDRGELKPPSSSWRSPSTSWKPLPHCSLGKNQIRGQCFKCPPSPSPCNEWVSLKKGKVPVVSQPGLHVAASAVPDAIMSPLLSFVPGTPWR